MNTMLERERSLADSELAKLGKSVRKIRMMNKQSAALVKALGFRDAEAVRAAAEKYGRFRG